jgi:hypothetical protein
MAKDGVQGLSRFTLQNSLQIMSKKRTARYRQDAERRKGAPAQPSGRIPADPSKQAPNNSYSPPTYFEDQPFVCVDCGKEEVWTARQQQWWYFVFEARNKTRQPFERAWIDYRRADSLFSVAFEREPRLIAELLDGTGACRVVALTEFDAPRSRADVMATVKTFASAVNEFMANLKPAT